MEIKSTILIQNKYIRNSSTPSESSSLYIFLDVIPACQLQELHDFSQNHFKGKEMKYNKVKIK